MAVKYSCQISVASAANARISASQLQIRSSIYIPPLFFTIIEQGLRFVNVFSICQYDTQAAVVPFSMRFFQEKAEPFARIIIHIQRVVHYTKHNRALDFYVLVFLTVSQLYDFFRIYQ